MSERHDEIHTKLDTVIEKLTFLQEENRRLGESLKAKELENEALKQELAKKEADLEALIHRIEQISL